MKINYFNALQNIASTFAFTSIMNGCLKLNRTNKQLYEVQQKAKNKQ